jgi:phage tail tape-measure protein
MSDAVQEALRTSLDLRDLQEAIRQAHNGQRFMSESELASLPDHGKGFSGNGATFKAARKAVLKAHVSLMSEAAEALLPYGASADRWAMHGSPDPLTYGSPVVTQSLNLTFAVDGRGTCYLPLTVVLATSVAMHATTRKDGAYRSEVIPLPWMSPVEAVGRTDPAWVADQWTAYRPDVNTVSADRFAAKRRPTSDESADPLAPVRKPSSRKRKRDGAMGGPAILSHR